MIFISLLVISYLIASMVATDRAVFFILVGVVMFIIWSGNFKPIDGVVYGKNI